MRQISINKREFSLREIALLLTYVLIGYLPFVGVFFFLGFVKEILCGLICLCAIANRRFRPNKLVKYAFAYCLVVVVGALFNSSLDLTAKLDVVRHRCLYPITFCALFCGFSFQRKELADIGRRICQVVFCTGFVVAVIAALEYILPGVARVLYGDRLTQHNTSVLDGQAWHRLVSTMGNPINLGFQMSLSLSAGIFLLHKQWKSASWLRRGLYLCALPLFVGVTIYTYSRIAYVTIAAAFLSFYLLQLVFRKVERKKKLVLLGVLGAVAVVGGVFLLINPEVATRLSQISLSSLLRNPRFERVRVAFTEAGASFWQLLFGHGTGSVLGAGNQYVFEFGYASLLFEAGIVGLLLFAVPVLYCLRRSIGAIRRGEAGVLLMLTFAGILLGFCVAMVAEDVYFQLPYSLYFWLSVFFVAAFPSAKARGGNVKHKRGTPMNLKNALKNLLPDPLYLKLRYLRSMGKRLDLKNPKTFNEKLQWLKIHDHNPGYTKLVDKLLVRDYIREKLGEEYLIPLIGAWDSPDEIDFDALPDQFVLKCNHNSGLGIYICRDKSKMDVEQVKENLRRGLAQDYYLAGREWPYKHVRRKVICEKLMADAPGASDFTDYKFFCFDGYVDCVMVCLERSSGDTKFYFFDENWELKRLNHRGKNAPEGFTIPKPVCMDEMFRIASELSRGIPFVRVDLYQSCGSVFFGEMTFFPASGFDPNLLPETDQYFGDLIRLNLVNGE